MVNILYVRQCAEIGLDGLQVAISTLKTKNIQDSWKKIEDEDLKTLLNEDRCPNLKQLSDTLSVTETAVSKRFQNLGLVQKVGNCLQHELSER